jgi:hypothetical protein
MGRVDLGQAFLERTSIEGVRFFHDDYVRVIAGQHAGKTGNLVTVLNLDPEPRFVLELDSGLDVEVVQSEIERASA